MCTGMDLVFCKGERVILTILRVGGFTVVVTLQNVKQEPSRVGGMMTRKYMFYKIAMLRTGSGKKSAVREISLIVHARVTNSEGVKSPLDPLNLPLVSIYLSIPFRSASCETVPLVQHSSQPVL